MLERLTRWFHTEKPRISRQESMAGVVLANPGIRSVEGPEGERMLFIPRRQPLPRLMKFLGAPREVPPGRLLLD